PVSVSGSALNVASQKSLSAVAGDISMSGGQISGEGSRVNLASVKSPGEVQLDANDINSTIDVSQFASLGAINLRNQALIDTSGPAGGPLVIRGGKLSLDNCLIFSVTSGSAQGGTFDISVTDDLKIVNRAFFFTNTLGSGRGGDLNVQAGSILIDGMGTPDRVVGIAARSSGAGD